MSRPKATPSRDTPEARSMRARMAAHHLHSRVTDPVAHTAPARRAFMVDRFERQVDPDGTLAPEERARRAEHARKAYFLGLSLAGVRARQQTAVDAA